MSKTNDEQLEAVKSVKYHFAAVATPSGEKSNFAFLGKLGKLFIFIVIVMDQSTKKQLLVTLGFLKKWPE